MTRADYPNGTLFIVVQADFRFYSLPDFPSWYDPKDPDNQETAPKLPGRAWTAKTPYIQGDESHVTEELKDLVQAGNVAMRAK
eukprot:8478758-Prorocentrum_lima.AAC.1